jgi:hypothetical protein
MDGRALNLVTASQEEFSGLRNNIRNSTTDVSKAGICAGAANTATLNAAKLADSI